MQFLPSRRPTQSTCTEAPQWAPLRAHGSHIMFYLRYMSICIVLWPIYAYDEQSLPSFSTTSRASPLELHRLECPRGAFG